MEIIKTTKTIEVTEIARTCQDTILWVEEVNHDKVCLIGKDNKYVYSLYHINRVLAHCNDDLRTLIHFNYLNVDELNSFLKGAIITIHVISIYFDGYGRKNDITRIVDIKLHEKAIIMIHNRIDNYILDKLGY